MYSIIRKVAALNVFRFFCLTICTWPSANIQAQQPAGSECVYVSEDMRGVNILPSIVHFEGTESHVKVPVGLGMNSFLDSLAAEQFRPIEGEPDEYVLGEKGKNHWLRLCAHNTTKNAQQIVLAFAPAVLAEVDFFPQKQSLPTFQTGNSKPFSTRDINGPQFHFNVFLQAGESQVFYLRIKSRAKAYVRASMWSKPEYDVHKDTAEILDGLYVGVLLGLILYTMLLYFWIRQPLSLLYVVWCTSTVGLLAAIDGRVLQYLLPNLPQQANFITVILYPVSVVLSALFARKFIQLKDFVALDKIGKALILIFILGLVFVYPLGYLIYFKYCAAFAFIVSVYFGLIAPVYGLTMKRSVLSKYLLLAQFPLIICVIDRTVFAMAFTSEYLVPYTPKVGLGASMVLMALCNGLISYREKEDAQKQAVGHLEAANRLQESYAKSLEAEVEEKTAEVLNVNVELEDKTQKLLELDKIRSTFFANISHEFRTPLTLIQGPLSNLLEGQSHPDEKVIGRAIRQSQSLTQLVDQLLMLSKFDGQSLSLKAAKMNVSDAVSQITAQFSSLAESKNIELTFSSTAQDLSAYLDLEKLQIVVNNLISNALKFTSIKGIVCVSVSSELGTFMDDDQRSTDHYVEIRVSDNGPGIPENELDYVFDRFYQSSSSTLDGSGTGTGIGLALVKELVQMHGGGVTVESTYGQANGNSTENGSTVFSVQLPLGKAHLSVNEIVASSDEAIISSAPTENVESVRQNERFIDGIREATVLVVDDNDDMRMYIRNLLEADYRVIEAHDGLEAEGVAQKHMPDLIITDLMMPKRDGIGFVEWLKKDSNTALANTPVIMLTAKAGLDDRLIGLLAAVDDYLSKPFDARELMARIDNLLKKHAQFKAFYASESAFSASPLESLKQGKEDKFILKARLLVDKNLSDSEFGVKELAEGLHVSRATLARRISQKVQFTPSEFIRHCRLEKARQLSLQGEVSSIKQLARSVGFSQASYFSRLYQKTFNTEPL